MSSPTVVFYPYAAAGHRDIVQTIVDSYSIADTGQTEWYPVAFFLRDENGEIPGDYLGDILGSLADRENARGGRARQSIRGHACTVWATLTEVATEREAIAGGN